MKEAAKAVTGNFARAANGFLTMNSHNRLVRFRTFRWSSMPGWRTTKLVLGNAALAALPRGSGEQDYRDALCRWEDALFARFPEGHRILSVDAARALIARVFGTFDRPLPSLELVAGFDDPKVGGLADVAGNRILIEDGCLYCFLILHESAHLLVPTDQRHGARFTYILQILYRLFIGIPERPVRELLQRHGLPSHTDLPAERRFGVAA